MILANIVMPGIGPRILADLQLNVGVSIHIPTVKFQHVGVMIVY